MLDKLVVENFKALRATAIDFSPLVVLAGANCAGKSTLIQSILLARASLLAKSRKEQYVPLNDELMKLGTAADLLPFRNSSNVSSKIKFTLILSGVTVTIRLEANLDYYDSASQRFLILNRVTGLKNNSKNFCDQKLGNFTYLSAERQGPRDYYERQSKQKEYMQFGGDGQYCADIISAYEHSKVENEKIIIPSVNGSSVPPNYLKQIEAWMQFLGFNLEIRTEAIGISHICALRYKGHESIIEEWTSPLHMGFGVSYCLPIIAAGLLARSGGIFIVDGPEAHLHPSAQSRIAMFLAQLADSGVQVIVETHSDHILNGIRIAANKEKIAKDKVSFISFAKENGSHDFEIIKLKDDGSLSKWPKTFFDQLEMDLSEISRAKRRL